MGKSGRDEGAKAEFGELAKDLRVGLMYLERDAVALFPPSKHSYAHHIYCWALQRARTALILHLRGSGLLLALLCDLFDSNDLGVLIIVGIEGVLADLGVGPWLCEQKVSFG